MAFDEAMVKDVARGGSPIFRLYSWDPFTLSLGRFQKAREDLDTWGVQEMNMPLVRRMTGGGALYHGEDFTYSLACTQEDLGNLTVKESFRLLCSFLVDTWKDLGWEAGFARDIDAGAPDLGVKTPVCFAGREELDVLVRTGSSQSWKKLGGNAQKRLRHQGRELIFQHGSVPIRNDWKRLNACLQPSAKPVGEPSADLVSLGWTNPRSTVEDRFRHHFLRNLDIQAVNWEPEGSFLSDVRHLASIKYLNGSWTLDGLEPRE